MRSEQVFRASEQVGNRYLLCRLAARTTRLLHFFSDSTQQAIENAFGRLAEDPQLEDLIARRDRASESDMLET